MTYEEWLQIVKQVAETHRPKAAFEDLELLRALGEAFEFGMSPGEACACIATPEEIAAWEFLWGSGAAVPFQEPIRQSGASRVSVKSPQTDLDRCVPKETLL